RAELEKANAATKQEADNALSAKAHAERNGYFSNIALAHQLYQGNSVARAREALDRCPEEFRNWEWRYLHRLCRSELQTYPGTRGMGLQLVALSPDGKQVIAASGERSGGKLLIWEAASGRTVHELPLPGAAFSLALSRDGKRVALALEGAVAVCELGAKPTVRLLGEPQGRYRGVVYTTDNRLLAGGYFTAAEERGQGGTGHIEVWDVEAGKKLHRLSGFHAAPEVILTYRTLAISPDGRHLAAAAFDTGARGSSEFRKVEQALPEPGRRTEDDKSKNEGPRKTKGGPPAPVEPQKPTPPGKPVQKAQPPAKDPPRPVPSHQGQLKVWNLAKGTEWILDNNINSLSDLAFSPDGRSLAWGNAAAVSLLDLDGSPTSSVLTGHQQGVHALAFSPDGQRLASGSEDTSIRIWDVKTGREQFALRGHGEPVLRVAFGRDGRQLVSAAGLVVGFAGEVKLWNATGGPEARTAFGPDGEISLCVALSSVAQQYVGLHGKLGEGIGPPKLELSSWSLDDHRLVWSRPFNVEEDAPLLGFSPDGTRLVGSSRKGIKILDARTGKVERFVPQERDQRARSGLPEPVAMSTDSRLLATAWVREEPRPGKPGPEQQPPKQELFVELWEADTGKPLGRLSTVLPPGDPGTTVVTALAFRPDGKQLATTVAILGGGLVKTLVLDGELQFWDIAARALTARHPTTHTLFGIAYSADGRLLAASGGTLSEGRAILCETAKGRELLKLRGHGKDVNAVAFSPDGSRLVTGAGDGTLIFWETATGQEVLTLRGHRRSVTTAAFSRDGRTLFSGTGFDLLEYMGAESASTGLRLPMEVKTWDAPR
ncbi:MAG TPA: WD40 repeat domain-containing protein, partial [Gemmataceae bacterium]|nr:WD40 repeat domain-containing protein [Gemmataceae bacterium]